MQTKKLLETATIFAALICSFGFSYLAAYVLELNIELWVQHMHHPQDIHIRYTHMSLQVSIQIPVASFHTSLYTALSLVVAISACIMMACTHGLVCILK